MRVAASHLPPRHASIPRCPELPAPVRPHGHRGHGDTVNFSVATVNDDFATPRSNLPRMHAGIVLGQEVKHVRVRQAMDPREYGTFQDRSSEARAGSSVSWRKGRFEEVRHGQRLGVEPHGAGMLTRWITFTDVKVEGCTVRMVSCHRPPKRFAHLWPEFDRHLAAFVKQTKVPMVIGMDANQRDPQALARLTGLTWRAPKGSIDGFLVSDEISVDHLRRLKPGSSDHAPVVGQFHLER